jgi:hypothetical protein
MIVLRYAKSVCFEKKERFFMIFICILSIPFLLGGAAENVFSSAQRVEAQEFINDCFEELEKDKINKEWSLSQHMEDVESVIDTLLNAEQIDFRRYRILDARLQKLVEEKNETRAYRESLLRPKLRVSRWSDVREENARILHAYITISDEWEYYKKNPSCPVAYERLHERMVSLAQLLIGVKDARNFVSGTHARPTESDADVAYDVDRIFMLTLYLLNKDFIAEKKPVTRRRRLEDSGQAYKRRRLS